MRELPRVDVVVPHYDDPRRLSWVLAALSAQTHPADRTTVVVADDGSPDLPRVPDTVTLVTQPDEGFRAAAARNLGARQGTAPYVLFLDGDTVPEPGYVTAMVEALHAADGGTGVLAVGTRRHADLETASHARPVPDLVADTTSIPESALFEDPEWLARGYAATDRLRVAGPDDWRLVISAVMGMTRAAFDRLGGFDETLVGYGGEDWDLAYRAWNTGVTLQHVPTAVAWHDGPDAGARPELTAQKEIEQLALARRIPQPLVRGRHLHWSVPRVLVRWQPSGGAGATSASAALAVVESWSALGDVRLVLDGPSPVELQDPRLTEAQPDAATLDRVEFVVEVTGQVCLRDPEAFLAAVAQAPCKADGVRAARTRHSLLRVPAQPLPAGLVEPFDAGHPLDLEAWGRRRWS